MCKRKTLISFICLFALSVCSFFGFFLTLNSKTANAQTVDLLEIDATVSAVGVYQTYPYQWFQIPESDYNNAGNSYSIKNNLEPSGTYEGTQTKYIDVLAPFVDDLFGKIEVDGNLVSTSFSSFSNRDPYFNLWNQITPSFSFALSTQAKSTIIVYQGATFPSHAYVADIVSGGTGEGKPVYVIKENTYFVGSNGTWTKVTETEFYNAGVKSFETTSSSGDSYATVSLMGAKYGTTSVDLSSYTEQLNKLNTTSYIKINDVKLSEHDDYKDKTLTELAPYFNYNATNGFSLKLAVANTDIVTFLEGCQIPTPEYIDGKAICHTVNKDTSMVWNSVSSSWQVYIPDQDITAEFESVKTVSWEDGIKIEIDVGYQFWNVGDGAFLVDANENGKKLLDYITLNGKSVSQINTETAGNNYSFVTFPGGSGGKYATATYVLLTNIADTGNRINLYVHGDYYKTLSEVVVGVSEEFCYYDGATNFTVTKSITFKEIYGSFINTENIKGNVDITATVNSSNSEIRPDGSASLRIDLSNVELTNLGYGANVANAISIFNFVKINGVTLSQINENTDTSDYDWNVCRPFSLGEQYHKVVNVYFTNGFMNVRIHPEYVKNVIGDSPITVLVELGFEVFDTDDGYNYKLSTGVNGVAIPARRILTVKMGAEVIATEKLVEGSMLNLGKYNVEKAHCEFNGFTELDGTAASNVMPQEDYTVIASYTAISYTVKFMNGNVQVGETLSYTIENPSVIAPAVPSITNKHYTAKWEDVALDGGNKIVNLELVAKTYVVTFKDGTNVLGVVTYSLDDTEIELPELPTKDGYKVGWEIFSLDGGNKTVKTVYEKIEEPKTEGGGCSSNADITFTVGIIVIAFASYLLTKKHRRSK